MTTTKRTLKRGDVVLVLFPHSDLRTAKPRPALIVQTDNLESGLPQVVVAMITSRVLIELGSPAGKDSGLLTDSVVMTDNLATIAEIAIDRIIGKIPMKEVDKALKHTLGL